jgi:hypothetical protein
MVFFRKKGRGTGGGWVLFATVLISRINSWESMFIFNLQKKNKSVMHLICETETLLI